MNFSKLIYQSFSWRIGYYLSLFALHICISRYFQSEATGWFNYVIGVCSLLILISGFSLDAALGYHVSKGTFDVQKLSGFIITWGLVAGLIAAPAAYAGYKTGYLIRSDTDLVWCTWLFIGGNLLITMLQSVFYAQNDFRFSNGVAMLFNFLLMCYLALCHYLNSPLNIFAFFQLYAICFFIQGLLFWLKLIWRKKTSFFGGFNLSGLRPLFRYASLVFSSNLVFFLVYRIDYWFVNRYCNEDLLGNYIQAAKLVQVFLILPASMASVIFPAVAGAKAEMIGKLKLLSRIMVSVFAIVLIIPALAGQWIFPALFGASFDKMYLPFLLLIPGIICLTVISLLGAYFGGKNLARVNLTGAVLALFAMVCCDILLIPLYQIEGAAIASSISYATYLAYMLYWFNKNEEKGITGFFICNFRDLKYVYSFFLKRGE